MPWPRIAALVAFMLLAWAAPAGATTYCAAPATGCGGGDLPTLAAALTAASGNVGADDVRLGPAGYTDGPWSYSDPTGTNPVTIRGAGFLQSQLISAGGGPTLSLNNGNVDNVLVRAPAAGVAVNLASGTLSNSQVLVTNNGRGVDASGATIDHVSKGYGLESGLPDTAISDSLIVLDDPTAVGVQGVCDLATGTISIGLPI